jgi:hypothetical protein
MASTATRSWRISTPSPTTSASPAELVTEESDHFLEVALPDPELFLGRAVDGRLQRQLVGERERF